MRIALLVVGALLALGGLVLLALPVSADLGRTTVDCGSSFAPGSEELDIFSRADEINEEAGMGLPRLHAESGCELALEDRGWVGWPLTGVGALVLVSGAFWRRGHG